MFGKNSQKSAPRGDEMRIYISPIMFVMALYFVGVGMAYEFCCSLTAVLLHECAHARVAKKLGYELNVIKLMPYGAALCGDVQLRPKDEVVIALAGPLFNLFIAVAIAAVWWLLPSSYMFTQAFCYGNVYIGLFNLLPVYPLDGGRVMLGILSGKLKRKTACRVMRVISIVFGLAAITLFALSAVSSLNLCLLSVGLFMTVSAFIPDGKVKYRALFAAGNRAERIKTPLQVRRYALSSRALLSDALSSLDADKYTEYTVLDDDMHVRGSFTETQLIGAVKLYGYAESVEKAVNFND
ncbi:MAG: site-2 protease family protein [Clostridiales bacterium]|nr:site-2 protease family protein [Clostridiales bacterium]